MNMPWNVKDLIKLYKDTNSGHFFDKATLDFFDSKISNHFTRLNDESALFITTEKAPDAERRATIRLAKLKTLPNGQYFVDIGNVGDFQAYLDVAQAAQAIDSLVQEEQRGDYEAG